MSTFVRIQIKENLALLHPHIALSFKLQPLSKCVRIKTQIQYSYCSLKFFFFFNESKGEAENTFISHSPVESLSMLFSGEAATEEQ